MILQFWSDFCGSSDGLGFAVLLDGFISSHHMVTFENIVDIFEIQSILNFGLRYNPLCERWKLDNYVFQCINVLINNKHFWNWNSIAYIPFRGYGDWDTLFSQTDVVFVVFIVETLILRPLKMAPEANTPTCFLLVKLLHFWYQL